MNRESIISSFAFLKLAHGVYKKMLRKFENIHLEYKPADELRTIKELVTHTYGQTGSYIYAIRNKELSKDIADTFEKCDANSINEIIKFTDNCFDDIFNMAMSLSDEQLNETINLYYGPFPAGQLFDFFFVEHIHHYGQLTVYARMLGIEPPFAYDFEN